MSRGCPEPRLDTCQHWQPWPHNHTKLSHCSYLAAASDPASNAGRRCSSPGCPACICPPSHRSYSCKQPTSPCTRAFTCPGLTSSQLGFPCCVAHVPSSGEHKTMRHPVRDPAGTGRTDPPLPAEPTRPTHGPSTCLPRVFFFPSQLAAAWGKSRVAALGKPGSSSLPASAAAERFQMGKQINKQINNFGE